MQPSFPDFAPLTVGDRSIITEYLRSYQPETSELTFTNIFIWKDYFGWEWSVLEDNLVLVAAGSNGGPFVLMPIGPPPRASAAREILLHLARNRRESAPAFERTDRRFVEELSESGDFVVQPSREHFDYVYSTQDLIELAGRKYHAKRNFINRFTAEIEFTYEPLTERHIAACLDLSDRWCRARRCDEDQGLMGEHQAVQEALTHFFDFELLGGVILIDGTVQAFAIGEALNNDTVVVHVEKADPDIRGMYTMINQRFCENALSQFTFVNREQDLGDEGLRKAKESYYPQRLVEKFRVGLK